MDPIDPVASSPENAPPRLQEVVPTAGVSIRHSPMADQCGMPTTRDWRR